jgi:hypothetical protein
MTLGTRVWGFLAASLIGEKNNYNNKRYGVYTQVLSRTYFANYKVFGSNSNTAIFVIPNSLISSKDLIISSYEKIFSETN